MVYTVPKDRIPQQQYTPAKYKDEIVMMTIVPRGVVIMFLDMNEYIFMEWDEIVSCAAIAPRQKAPVEMEEEKPAPDRKPGLREIKKPN
jgi:hypothetical protein